MGNDNRGPVTNSVKESTAPEGDTDSKENGLWGIKKRIKKAVQKEIKEAVSNTCEAVSNTGKELWQKAQNKFTGTPADSNKKKDNTEKMLSENLPVQGHQKPTPLDEIIRNKDQIRPLLNKTEDICLDENWIDQRATPQKLLLVWQDTLSAESELLYNKLASIERSKKRLGRDEDTIALETLKAWMSWLHNEDMHLKRKGNYGDRVLITREIRGDYQNWKDLCEDGTDVDFEAYIEYGPWYYTKDNQDHLLSLGSLSGRTDKDKK